MPEVWTFPPNWDDGVLETLEWLTAVLGSQTGVEQRIGRRQTPRRSFEAGFLVTERNRRYLDSFISSVGKEPFYLPIWHDIGVTDSPTAMGADFIETDTQFREFSQGGFAYLRGSHAMESEVVEIASVASNGLQLIANTERAWPKGTRIYPLILATLPAEVSGTKGTDEFMRFNIRFNSAQANPYLAVIPPISYRDAPVLNVRPDESEDLTHTYLRLTAALDNETGVPVLYDKAGHGFRTQQYRWAVVGRQAHQELRSLFYYLSGKLKAVWLPTFMQDFKLVRPVNPGDSGIFVQNIGYSRFNLRLLPGMQDIRIEKRDRTYLYGRIVGGVEIDDDMEALSIDLDLSDPLRVEDVVSISFMNLCRLDNDSIEINHPTDAAGVSQAAVITRTSPGIRAADPWTPIPFGDTVKNGMQALCDCLCSDFYLSDDYVVYENNDTGRHYTITPERTDFVDGWQSVWATEGNVLYPPQGESSPVIFLHEASIVLSSAVASEGITAKTQVRIWGTGAEGYTQLKLVYSPTATTAFLPLSFVATPGGPTAGAWVHNATSPVFDPAAGNTFELYLEGGIVEPYVPGRELPPVGAGEEAWIRVYADWPWIEAPAYTEAGLRSFLDSFATMNQTQARQVISTISLIYFTPAEIAAMSPDAVNYSNFCDTPGMPEPGPLQPRLAALREAYVRTVFYSDLRRIYSFLNTRIAADIPEPEPGILAEFCINPAPLDYEGYHRTANHLTNYHGAGGALAAIAAGSSYAWPLDGSFVYPLGQRAKATSFMNQVIPRLSTGGINGSVIRPRAGGTPLFFLEGHESFQYATLFECPTGEFPLDGSYGPNFWEEWSWFSMGAMLVDAPWPTDITVEVSRIAPFAIINVVAYKTVTRTVGSGRYVVYWMKVNERHEEPNFFANPFPNDYEVLPGGNTSYLIRIRELLP
jgi:hypothetical protein